MIRTSCFRLRERTGSDEGSLLTVRKICRMRKVSQCSTFVELSFAADARRRDGIHKRVTARTSAAKPGGHKRLLVIVCRGGLTRHHFS